MLLISILAGLPKLVNAQEYVGGMLTADAVYSKALNPYIVTEPLIVPAGITLTIEPGVQLNFMVRTSLRIEGGTLIADGTENNRIIFTAHGASGENEKIWDGIVFFVSGTEFDADGNYVGGNLIRSADVKLTTTGIGLSDTALLLAEDIRITNCSYGVFLESESSLVLRNSLIDRCSYGMYIKNSGSNEISSSSITNCDIGIFFPSNNTSRFNRIINNNISNNRNIALFLSLGQSQIQYNLIHGNTVAYNNIGLHIGNGGTEDAGFNTVSGNIIHNNDIGIKLSQDKDTLRGNHLENNETGILLSRASLCVIEQNFISNSSNWGIILTDASNSNVLSNNSVLNNFAGIKVTEKDLKYSTQNQFNHNSLSGNQNEVFLFEAGPQSGIHFNSIRGRDNQLFVNRFENDLLATNNYWFTNDTLLIDQMIFDVHDDSSFGEVIYKPFLESPDPSSPISAPELVIKRLAGDQILLSWLPNVETDLAGYKVYYNTDDGASFNQVIDVGMNTDFILGGINFGNLIAVTAYDSDADGNSDQTEGHESNYSYAIPGPWAGSDAVVCGDVFYSTANATAIEYTSLLWTTQGDGIFDDPGALNTIYRPGTGDKIFGSVILTLTTGYGNLLLSDSIKVSLDGVPEVFAGNDTIINQLTGYYTELATAANYTRIYWETSGDGFFGSDTLLLTQYIPGPGDIETGLVTITLFLESGCGNISDALQLQIFPAYRLRGTVHSGNSPVYNAAVVALATDPSGSRAVDMVNAAADGTFIFDALLGNDYFLYAIPDPEGLSGKKLPTYYAGKTRWQSAYLMSLTSEVWDVDIHLQDAAALLPGGNGSISGSFHILGDAGRGNDIYLRQWFEWQPVAGNSAINNPAVNHVVLLMNPSLSHIFSWELTDVDGNFSFTDLPHGNYRLWGEKAGHINSLSPVIKLSPGNNTIDNVQLLQNQKQIEISVPGAPDIDDGIFRVYPNPASEMIWINTGRVLELPIEVKLISSSGKVVRTFTNDQAVADGLKGIDISNLAVGIYLLEVTLADGQRFLKKVSVVR
jgi:parallel beta-helix repeat protein